MYENAVILSLKIKDREAFERSLCQLKEFYINTWFVSPTTIDFMIHPCQAMFSCYFNIWTILSLDAGNIFQYIIIAKHKDTIYCILVCYLQYVFLVI